MRDQFGTVMKRGKNISVLHRARNHYVEKGIRIKDYYFSTDCSNKRVVKGDEEFLQKCDICSLPLFKFLVNEHVETGNKVVVVPKRKLMFIDSDNVKHMACYKQSECLHRVDETPCDEAILPEVPSFEEFLGSDSELLTGSESTSETELVRSAKAHFNNSVKPFISFWRDKEITKKNMMSFLVNFKTMLGDHLIYYEEYTDSHPHNNHLAIENKILALIGIGK